MKCFVVKASPRGGKASSSKLADAFIRGLKSAGADVTEIILRDKNIKHCTGCYTCWTKTPGKCIHRDDMDLLLPQFEQSDLIVYATPLYYFSVPGILKDFMDRGLPILQPYLVANEDRTSHPRRNPKEQKFVLISTAGFPENSVFAALERQFEIELDNPAENFVGKILVGGAEPLHMDGAENTYRELFEAVETAGIDVVLKGRVSAETEKVLEKVIQDRVGTSEEFGKIANGYWKSLQPENDSEPVAVSFAPGAGDRECRLNAGGMETLMAGMALSYNDSVRPGLSTVIQFDFEGEGYYQIISGGDCKAYNGFHGNPVLTILSPADVWEAVSEGRLSGADGLISGKYKVEGDMALMMNMQSLFQSANNEAVPAEEPSESEKSAKGRGPVSLSGGMWMTVAFLPWMMLWIGQSFSESSLVPFGALGLSVLIGIYHLITNKMTFFEAGTMIFMVIQAFFTWHPHPLFNDSDQLFQYLFLAAVWGGSLARKFSLTGEYVRYDYPSSVWKLPSFRDTNRILTVVWALYYIAAALICYLSMTTGPAIWIKIAPYGLLLPMFIFTGWFQKWYPVRLMKQVH